MLRRREKGKGFEGNTYRKGEREQVMMIMKEKLEEVNAERKGKMILTGVEG